MKEVICWGGRDTEASLYAQICKFLFVALLTIVSACDSVTETPEPDQFAQTQLLTVAAISDTNGEAVIDVLECNKLNEALSVSFTKPAHGSIENELSSSHFRYKAIKGFNGLDTFSYKICRSSLCKEGKIRIDVKQPELPCKPTFAENGSYRDTVEAAASMSVGLHPQDILCPESQLSFISCSWNVPITLDYTGFHFGLPSWTFTKNTEVRFIYRVCDKDYKNCSEVRTCSTLVKINNTYCDKIFKVNDFPFPVSAKKNKQYKFEKFRALQNVISCENDIDDTYFIVYASPAEAVVVYSEQTGSYLVSPPDVSSNRAKVHYEIRNKRGVKGTGQAIINFVL